MRDRNPVLLGAVSLVIASAPLAGAAVAAGGEGPYFGLKVAGAHVEDSEADGVDIEYDTGFAISGQVGYQFRGFRLEGEFGYQGLEGLSETDVNTDVDVGRFTLNAYADLPIAPNLGPYFGGGFGVASLSTDNDFDDPDAFDDQDSAFTWHAETGLNIDLTDQFTVSPFYRYQWIDTDLGQQSEPLVSHLFGVSLRYVLNWHGRSSGGGDRYSGSGYDRGGYGGAYGGAYGGYRSRDRYDRYDRYDRHDHHHDRPRKKKRKSAEKKERDRCGWKGAGCEDEDERRDGWGG